MRESVICEISHLIVKKNFKNQDYFDFLFLILKYFKIPNMLSAVFLSVFRTIFDHDSNK